MPSVSVAFTNIAGTEAALGLAGSHSVVADRPVGKAGGLGLGFNGAELLALAIGGCFCNDLRYVAHQRGVAIDKITACVTVNLDGDPILAHSAEMVVTCTTLDGSDPAKLVDQARASCMMSNSLSKGIPVAITMAA